MNGKTFAFIIGLPLVGAGFAAMIRADFSAGLLLFLLGSSLGGIPIMDARSRQQEGK